MPEVADRGMTRGVIDGIRELIERELIMHGRGAAVRVADRQGDRALVFHGVALEPAGIPLAAVGERGRGRAGAGRIAPLIGELVGSAAGAHRGRELHDPRDLAAVGGQADDDRV